MKLNDIYIKYKDNKYFPYIALCAVYCFTYLFFEIFFESGDDIAMQQIVAGYFANKPDEHLIFINVIIGFFLKYLYQINPNFYWYSLLMLILQALSLLIILKYVLKKTTKFWLLFSTLILFNYFIIRMQFTSISALLSIAGFLLLVEKLFDNKYKNNILAFCFFMFSVLIRKEIFFFMILFFGVYLLIELHFKGVFKFIKRNFVFISITLVVAIATIFYNESQYENAKWKDYNEFNKIIGHLNNDPTLINIDISLKNEEKADYKLVKNFVFPKKYNSIPELKKVQEKVKKISIFKKLGNSFLILKSTKSITIPFVFFVIMFFYYAIKKDKKAFYFLFFIAMFFYINLSNVFKPRLVYSVMMFTFLMFFVKENTFLNKFNLIYMCFAVCCFSFFYRKILVTKKSNFVYASNNFPTDKMIVVLGVFPIVEHPFKLNENKKFKNLIDVGWFSNLPVYKEKLAQYHLKVPKFWSALDEPEMVNNCYYFYQKEGVLVSLMESLKYKKLKLVPLKGHQDIYKMEKIK